MHDLSFHAEYREGVLRPDRPLHLRSGERVVVTIARIGSATRWDLHRLAEPAVADELALSVAGLESWDELLHAEDKR